MVLGLKRKVIRIKAEDSPNVRYALAEVSVGKPVSGRMLVPGVKGYAEYLSNRRDWDPIQQCVSLDADWYEGEGVLWFPPEWLNLAEQAAVKIKDQKRTAKAIGIDTAEGGDETAIAVVDDLGLIYLWAERTPNTAVIPGKVLAVMREYWVPPEKVFFDRGGGGYEHACTLRQQGYNVGTVGFGETVVPPVRRRGLVPQIGVRIGEREERYAYKNRRAEMHGILRGLLNPRYNEDGIATRQVFALPMKYTELRRQLAPVPMWYDEEGRIYLPPKQLKADAKDNQDKLTINKLLGCSPDQSDALILAVYGMQAAPAKFAVRSMV
jgi:hypothetical protein